MAHDHTFDCTICGAHLDSQRELDDHNRNKHPERISTKPSGDISARQSDADRDRKKINDLERL